MREYLTLAAGAMFAVFLSVGAFTYLVSQKELGGQKAWSIHVLLYQDDGTIKQTTIPYTPTSWQNAGEECMKQARVEADKLYPQAVKGASGVGIMCVDDEYWQGRV